MKIKNSNKKIKSIHLIFPFIAILIISVAIRSYQVLNIIDSSTGFYKRNSFTIGLLYALIFISIIIAVGISYISYDSSKIDIVHNKSKLVSSITYAVSFAFLIDSISSFHTCITTPIITSEYISSNIIKDMLGNGTISAAFRFIFALLSAIYFLLLANSYRTNSANISNRKIIALSPVVWSAMRLMMLFVNKISFIRISDLFLEIIMMSLLSLFFISFAQATSGVYSETTVWKLPAFGLPSAILLASTGISRLLFIFVKFGKIYIEGKYPFNLCDIILCIFILTLLFYKLKNADKAEDEETVNIDNNIA